MSREKEHLEQAISALEAQRATLGDDVVNAALAPLRQKLLALQAQHTPSSSPQRKQVTVLFADVSGFTAMSESMDPEMVSQTMNALWQRLDTVITRHGGTIDKHIGDAVMALFGAPVAREDAPEQAIRAALKMQVELANFAASEHITGVHKNVLEGIQMRIGINTGLVMLDVVGTTTEYTAIGDAVNVASRLEHAAPVGGILVSHDTYKHVRGLFDVAPLEPLAIKGKGEPVHTYLVKGIRPRAFRVPTRGVVGVETRTIGREAELDQLKEMLSNTNQGARVVTITADAGTGKSRLLYEFTNWLDLQPESVQVFKARATEEMENLPYSLIRDLFAFQFGIAENDSAAAAREKLEQGLYDLIGSTAHEQAPFIGHLIGLDYSANHHLQGILHDARQTRDRAFHYITRLFVQVANAQPVAIFLEDIHWADDSSLNLIEHLVRECRDQPVLIVALARSTLYERRSNWSQDQAQYTRLNLGALSVQDTHRLVDEILRKLPEIPTELRELILNRAEGNPFYVEEIVKMMIDDRVIEVGEEAWSVKLDRLKHINVPPTLTGVLQARLEGLPDPERRTLQRASVVGRVFWDDVLNSLLEESQELSEPPAPVVGESLTKLQVKELVFRHGVSAFRHTDEYIFKHAILRDVTYESVLLQLRRIYHAKVAAWLAERSADRAGEFAGRIGEHHERAGNTLSAAEWYAHAGNQAKATYAPETAAGYFRRALDIWAESHEPQQHIAQQIEALNQLGEALNWLGRFSEAASIFEQMREFAVEAGDTAAEARAWQSVGGAQMYQGNLPAALESATRAAEIARKAGASLELSMSLSLQGWARLRLGEPEAALKLGEEAVQLARNINNQVQTANCLNFLGGVNFMIGRYEPAARYLKDALQIFRDLDSRDKSIDLLNNLGVIAEAHGDYLTAFERYQEALTMAREIGRKHKQIQFLSNLGGVRVKLGEYAAGETDLREAIAIAENAKMGMLSETYRMLGEACLGQAKADEALEAALRALALGQQFDAQDNIAGAWRTLGLVAAFRQAPVVVPTGEESSEPFAAAACFEHSLEVYTRIGMEGEQGSTLRSWATYELEHGDRARGEEMWNQAREIFTRLGAQHLVEAMASLPSAQ